jgi:hypothetical protein
MVDRDLGKLAETSWNAQSGIDISSALMLTVVVTELALFGGASAMDRKDPRLIAAGWQAGLHLLTFVTAYGFRVRYTLEQKGNKKNEGIIDDGLLSGALVIEDLKLGPYARHLIKKHLNSLQNR